LSQGENNAANPAPDCGGEISFLFDGKSLSAREGDSIAAALTASGMVRLRRTATGEPRGLFCGMGVCNDCLVEVDGTRSRRACMTAVKHGMNIITQDDCRLGPMQDALLAKSEDVETADVAIVAAGPTGLTAAMVRLGRCTSEVPSLAARVARIGRFQSALWQLYKAPPPDNTSAPDDLLICRCESVSL